MSSRKYMEYLCKYIIGIRGELGAQKTLKAFTSHILDYYDSEGGHRRIRNDVSQIQVVRTNELWRSRRAQGSFPQSHLEYWDEIDFRNNKI